MNTAHPYIKEVIDVGEGRFRVTLSQDFPLAGFVLYESSHQTGYFELSATIGIEEPGGDLNWISGTGNTLEEAIEDALQNFLNTVVHPSDLSSEQFVEREIGT